MTPQEQSLPLCVCRDANCQITYGFCHCGCGEKTVPFRFGSKRDGTVAGQPRRYITGHTHRYSDQEKKNISKSLKKLNDGEYIDGKITSTYSAWRDMQRRCYNPKRDDYKHYGGRGIKVCDRWLASFSDFRADMGECPKGLTLERNDVNGNYEPDNCRWATRKEQSNNTRANIIVEWNGQNIRLRELCTILQLHYGTIYQRVRNGWPMERVINEPRGPARHTRKR
jgi:hypothetical protein